MSGVSTGMTLATTVTLPNETRKGPANNWPPSLARWLLAAPHKGCPHCGAFEYSARVQIHRLRFQNRAILYYLKFSLLAAKSEFRTPTINGSDCKTHSQGGVLFPRVGAGAEAVGKTARPFRGLLATGGLSCKAARRRCRQKLAHIHPAGATPIATAKWFRRSCHAENGEKQRRPESVPGETSFPALPP